jgi:hypothetical protein
MRLKAKIYRISEVATMTVDSRNLDTVKDDIKSTAEKFPEKLNFVKPKKDESFIVQVEQVG